MIKIKSNGIRQMKVINQDESGVLLLVFLIILIVFALLLVLGIISFPMFEKFLRKSAEGLTNFLQPNL
ncbi:hypothetical protein AKJ62_03470 [candidate division MSBL1 archaeon SCGC-AAA259D14]|uniref:Uncharacterized protein n=2 Tax=candidate division MSBL1 TaxID=215777 RepID=A0A133U4X8_9EURY|nr:hypothetical protein AKJ62_03470 [candidate division MSBL1 archaeon SCGC-AAA259D14]KXA89535.1 hypothetical protein AKJ61_02640 [candidate division MSBL1 archaeon SCGC-AAA259B11]